MEADPGPEFSVNVAALDMGTVNYAGIVIHYRAPVRRRKKRRRLRRLDEDGVERMTTRKKPRFNLAESSPSDGRASASSSAEVVIDLAVSEEEDEDVPEGEPDDDDLGPDTGAIEGERIVVLSWRYLCPETLTVLASYDLVDEAADLARTMCLGGRPRTPDKAVNKVEVFYNLGRLLDPWRALRFDPRTDPEEPYEDGPPPLFIELQNDHLKEMRDAASGADAKRKTTMSWDKIVNMRLSAASASAVGASDSAHGVDEPRHVAQGIKKAGVDQDPEARKKKLHKEWSVRRTRKRLVDSGHRSVVEWFERCGQRLSKEHRDMGWWRLKQDDVADVEGLAVNKARELWRKSRLYPPL